jgi:low molecular weight protein-tyrosine phosphatase
VGEPFEILVVCLGNVCRSPLAERVLRLRLDELLGDGSPAVRVSSAGARALVGQPMDEQAATELRRLGGDPDGFTATQLTAAAAEGADLVLTATRELRSRVLEEAPRALRRTFTIRELAALLASEGGGESAGTADLVARAAARRGAAAVEEYDVTDPYGRPQEVHREVADVLDRDCTTIARAVAAALRTEASLG